MTTLATHAADLNAAWKLLQARWDTTGETWTDQVHDEFAAHYWQPLEQETQAAQHSLERLAQVVIKAQRSVK
jgi:hypothetical protein